MPAKRRVLIVTGSYAPAMIADMHRVRQLAWHLPALGWDVDIFCPDESYQPRACLDHDSAAFFADTPIRHVPARMEWLFRALGVGSIGIRAALPALSEGSELIRQRRYDLVYFSTAQFMLFLLGPAWRRRFAVPYVLDLHDPLRTPQSGAGLKQRLSRMLSAVVEASAVKAAAGLISVSPRYLDDLRRDYAGSKPAWLAADRHAVIPFAVRPEDLAEAARSAPPRRADATAKIVYVGTGGPIMRRSFDLLCRAIAHLRAQGSDLPDRVRIELHGTASALGGDMAPHLAGIAREHGFDDIVSENPSRVTYRRSLELLLHGDGALILGVDDAGYMPSKLFTYAYSGKPVLASLHRDSPALALLRQRPELGHAVWFGGDEEMPIAEGARIVGAFLTEVAERRQFDRQSVLAPYSAAAMARRHAELFEACLE